MERGFSRQRAMDVKTVCLGMLSGGEASGYDLKKEFESSFSHFFAAGYGSIYPALAALADNGLVTCEQIAQEGKPDRKVYRITNAGYESLLEALDRASPSHKIRSEFLAMLCFAHLMTPERIDEVIDQRLDDIRRNEALLDDVQANSVDDSWTSGMKFVLGFGRAVTEAARRYIEQNRHTLVTNREQTDRKAATG